MKRKENAQQGGKDEFVLDFINLFGSEYFYLQNHAIFLCKSLHTWQSRWQILSLFDLQHTGDAWGDCVCDCVFYA